MAGPGDVSFSCTLKRTEMSSAYILLLSEVLGGEFQVAEVIIVTVL